MKKWIQAARLYVIGASVLPAAFGGLFAYYKNGAFAPSLFVLTVIGIALIHSGANLINDYFDFRSGADLYNPDAVFPYSGGSRVIVEGKIRAEAVLCAAILCYSVASLVGIYLTYRSGWAILPIGIVGIASSILYVSPRFSMLKLGIGEIVLGLDFGVLTVLGAYYVQMGGLSFAAFMASLPLAIIIALILIVNEFPDYRGDLAADKRTVVVRLGKKKTAVLVNILLLVTAFLILFNALAGFTSRWSLTALLALPFMLKTAFIVAKHYDDVTRMLPANRFMVEILIIGGAWLIISCLLSGGLVIPGLLLTGLLCFYQIVTMKKYGLLTFPY